MSLMTHTPSMVRSGPFPAEANRSGDALVGVSDYRGGFGQMDPETGIPYRRSDELQALREVFGNPRRKITTEPGESVPVENDDFLDAYGGRNQESEIMIQTVYTAEDMTPSTEALPIERRDGAITKEMTSLTFNDHLLRNAPEETAPHFVTHTTSSSTISLDRKDLGAKAEKGFWKTKRGQIIWAGQLRQIGNAIKATANLAVMVALTNSDNDYDPQEKFRVRGEDGNDMMVQLAESRASFGCGQHRLLMPNVQRHNELLAGRPGGRNANYIIMPAGMEMFCEGPLEENAYNVTGRPMPTPQQAVSRVFSGATLRYSKGTKMENDQPDYDPLLKKAYLGNAFAVNNTGLELIPPASFTTKKRSVKVYDERGDRRALVHLLDCLKFSGTVEHNNDAVETYALPTKFTKYGEIFFGRFKSIGAFLYHNDKDGYWIRTLLAKPRDVQIAFAKTLMDMWTSQRTGTPQRQDPTAGLFSRVFGSGKSGKRASHEDDDSSQDDEDMQDQVDDDEDQSSGNGETTEAVIKGASWATRGAKTAAMSFLKFLQSIDQKFDQLGPQRLQKVYDSAVRALSGDESVHIDALNWDTMAKELLAVDVYASVTQIVQASPMLTRNDILATPFEDAYADMQKHAGGMGAKDEIKQQLLQAANASPYWAPRGSGNGRVSIKVLAVPGDYDATTRSLALPALSYSLSSTNLVLFAVDTDVIEQMRESQGKITIVNTDAGSDMRDALLQLSVTLSAVYHLVADAEHNDYMAQLGGEIKKIVAKGLLGNAKNTKPLLDACTYAKQQKLSALRMQTWAAKPIASIFALLSEVYTSKRGTRVDFDTHAERILSQVQECCKAGAASGGKRAKAHTEDVEQDESDTEDNDQASTGAGMRRSAQRAMGDQLRREDIEVKRILRSVGSKDRSTAKAAQVQAKAKELVDSLILLNYPQPEMRVATPGANGKRGNLYIFNAWQEAFQMLAAYYLLDPKNTLASATKKLQDFTKTQIQRLKASETQPEEYKKMVAAFLFILSSRGDATVEDIESVASASDPQAVIQQKLDLANTSSQAAFSETINRINALAAPAVNAPAAASTPKSSQPGAQSGGPSPQQQQSLALFNKSELQALVNSIRFSDARIMNFCLQNDIYFPIGFVCMRPRVCVTTGSAIMMQGGGETGHTYIANPMSELGHDATRMMVMLHFACYMKAAVERPEKMVLLRHVIIKSYHSGNDLRFYDPQDTEDVEDFRSGNGVENKSIFCYPEDVNFKIDSTILDITGEFHPSMGADAEAARNTKLTMARAFGELWGFTAAGPSPSADQVRYAQTEAVMRGNTLCSQAQTEYWNEVRGDWTLSIAGQTLYGSDGEYDGSGRVRRGLQQYYTPPIAAA